MIFEYASGGGSATIKISRDGSEPLIEDPPTPVRVPTFRETWALLNAAAETAGDDEVTFDEVTWYREKVLGIKRQP